MKTRTIAECDSYPHQYPWQKTTWKGGKRNNLSGANTEKEIISGEKNTNCTGKSTNIYYQIIFETFTNNLSFLPILNFL
jgi:hypothetical protein